MHGILILNSVTLPTGTYAARCSLGFKIISFDNSVWLFSPGCARLIDTDYFLLIVNYSGLGMTLLGFHPSSVTFDRVEANSSPALSLTSWCSHLECIPANSSWNFCLTVLEVNGLQITIQQGVYIYKSPGSHHYGLYLINKIIFPNKQSM